MDGLHGAVAGRLIMPVAVPPLLSVVLVNHNGRDQLHRCLPSLAPAAPEEGMEIIVVDNDSRDGSCEFIRRCFPEVHLIALSRNMGFGAANNRGAAAAQGEFLLFLNTDTVVYPGSLERLLNVLRLNDQAGAAGPALIQEGGRFQVSFGGRVNFFSEMWKKFLGNFCARLRLKRMRTEKDVVWLSGACLLVRRTAWEQTAGFDENFFLYFEDIDLCRRLRQKGWRLIYVPSARLFHEGGASTASMKMESRLHYRTSQLRFYRKHNRGWSRACLKLYLMAEYVLFTWRGKWRGKETLRVWYRKRLTGSA